MKKVLKIVVITLVVIISIILLDSLQALLFNNSPIIKLRNKDNDMYWIDQGVLVDTYIYCKDEKKKIAYSKFKEIEPLNIGCETK